MVYKKNFKKPGEWPVHTVYSDVELFSFGNYEVHDDQESVANVSFCCSDPLEFSKNYVQQKRLVEQARMVLSDEEEVLEIYHGILLSATGLEHKMLIGDLLFERDGPKSGRFTVVKKYE